MSPHSLCQAGLPGAVMAATGAIRIDPATVQLDGLALAMLDARATVSGKVSDYRGKRLEAQASVADGAIGEKFVAWFWRKIDLPELLQPKTPVLFSARSEEHTSELQSP